MVASECAPAAQAGGLGEVIFGLSRELELRGHTVEIIMPKYDCMRYDQVFGLAVAYQDLQVPWYSGSVHCTVWSGFVHGRKCFFIDPHSPDQFFGRGHLYGSPDDVARFAFLSKAALEFMWKSGKRPEVIHCHDWQTAVVPVLLYEVYQHMGMRDQRVCYTVHNFAHQGICGEHVLWATGLTRPEHFFDDDRLRDNFNHSAINLMKGGIVYSNFITTVSPQHAWEATYTDQGMGLGQGLSRQDLGGSRVPPLVTQIADGENGGVMMNEFPPKYFEVIRESSGTRTPAMNVTEYLEWLGSAGIGPGDLPVIQPLFQSRIWGRMDPGDGPDRLAKVIGQLHGEDGRFHMEGGSWTNNISWVRGYEQVLAPMDEASSLFHERVLAKAVRTDDPRYRNALFHLLAAEESDYRYWGQGTWADYGAELARRAIDIVTYDL